LISILSYTFNNPDITVNTRFDPCLLGVEIAMPLGLIVNEILTNAFKYAFLSRKEGQLWIDLRLLDGNQEHPPPYTHSLTIRDNGKGLPDDFSFESQKTMGSQIIYLLIGQIAGNLSYSNNHGASFTILFRDEKIE